LPGAAQDFRFEIAAGESLADVSALTVTALPSTVIGDHDATDNPGGTRTVPGLFGGGGNNPIQMDLALGTDSSFIGAPTGNFLFDLDLQGLVGNLRDLDVDLLGGASADSTLSVSMLYSTFRSFAPDSLYPGGVPFELPLASQSISNFRLVQIGGAVPVVLVQSAEGGLFHFATAVPVEFSFEVDFLGQLTPVGPVPGLLPLTGTVTRMNSLPRVQIDFTYDVQEQLLDPLSGFLIDDLPLPLPTILPPGETANLLLDATIASIDVDLATTVHLVAEGVLNCGFDTYCAATPNSTGQAGMLIATGSTSVEDAALTLTATKLPGHSMSVLLMSQSRANLPILNSQGITCLGDPVLRFSGQVRLSNSAGVVAFHPDFDDLPQGIQFLPGSTWNFQVFHRDMNPQSTSNTTSAARVHFCL